MHSAFFRLTSASAAASAVVVAIYACGGGTTSVAGGGTGDASSGDGGGGGGGGGEGGLSSSCPAGAPSTGGTCSNANLECEYGSDPNVACNVVATCSGTTWNVSTPGVSPTCPTANAATCPASKDALPQGATCIGENVSCTYSNATCICHMDCGSQFPVGHACEAGTPLTWDCGTPAAGCPAERPHLGSTCAAAGLECNYGHEPCEATSFLCESGTWHSKRNACPVSTARMKKEIHYLSGSELQQISEDTQALRLTTYRYKDGDPAQHLGFIIEDAPQSPAVLQGRDRIDLYGYTSMTVATLQVQEKQIAELRREVDSLRRDMAAQRASCGK